METIALDVASGVFLGGLPLVCIFMAMIKRTQGDTGRAWAYGMAAFIIGATLIAGIFDVTIWH